jgi:hypothetical protein
LGNRARATMTAAIFVATISVVLGTNAKADWQ